MSGKKRAGASRDDHWGSGWPTAGAPDVPGFAQLRLVGSGGSATVYRATELRHDRPVALKILDVQAGDSQKRAFSREVDAIARIEPHPNVITLLGSGVTPNGHPYLVFPFFDGGTFAEWIDERGPLTWSAAIDIAIKVCSAVETVHRAGLIHRDVKPANLFIGVTPAHPVLGDFGISTLVEGVATRTVKQAITAGYTAPEILHDDPATTISDVYSLGMTVFRIIQGLHAYYADSPAAVMRNVLNQSDAPHLSAGVPPSLDQAVTQALAQDAAERPQTALEFARDLQAVQADHYLPVTPLLVTGEPGVLGEEEPHPVFPPPAEHPVGPPETHQASPPPQRPTSLEDEAPPSILQSEGAASVTNTPTDETGGDGQVDLNDQVSVAHRPEAGAILAAAVNPDPTVADNTTTEDQAVAQSTAADGGLVTTAEPQPTERRLRRWMVQDGAVPDLPRPMNQDSTPQRVIRQPERVGRIGGREQLPPQSLDLPTQFRVRKPRSELLAPKVQVKKKRWWSKLTRRSESA